MHTKKRVRKIRPQHLRASMVNEGSEPELKFEFWSYKGGFHEEQVRVPTNIYALEQLAKVVNGAMASIRDAKSSEWHRVNKSMTDLFGETK